MTIDPMDPKIAADSAMNFATNREIRDLEEMAKGGSKNIEKVAAKFEAIFLGFLLKQMWESVEKSDLLSESPGKRIYDGFFTSMMADHLAEGGGVGLAKSLVSQLERAAQAYEQQMNRADDLPEAKGTD